MADDLLNLQLPDFGDFTNAGKVSGASVHDLALPDLPDFNLNLPSLPDVKNADTITLVESNDHTSSEYFTNPHGYEEDLNEALSISSDTYNYTLTTEKGDDSESKKENEDNNKPESDKNSENKSMKSSAKSENNNEENLKSEKSSRTSSKKNPDEVNNEEKSENSQRSRSSRKSQSRSRASKHSSHKASNAGNENQNTKDSDKNSQKSAQTPPNSLTVEELSTASESLLNLDKNSQFELNLEVNNLINDRDSIASLLIQDDVLTENGDPLNISDASSPASITTESSSFIDMPIQIDFDRQSIKSNKPDFTEDDLLKQRMDSITDQHALDILNRLRHEAIKRAETLAEEKTTIDDLKSRCRQQELDFYKKNIESIAAEDDLDSEDSKSIKQNEAEISHMKRKNMIREDEIEDALDELNDLQKQYDLLQASSSDKDRIIAFLENQKLGRYEMENTIPILNDDNERLRHEYDLISKRHKKTKEKYKAISERLVELSQTLEKLKRDSQEREAAIKMIDPEKQRLEELEQKVKLMKKNNTQLKKSINTQLSEGELRRLIPQIRLVIRTKESIIKNMSARIEQNKEDMEILKSKIQKLEKEESEVPQPFPVVPPLYPPMTPSKEIMDHLAHQPLYSHTDFEQEKPPMTEPKRRRQ